MLKPIQEDNGQLSWPPPEMNSLDSLGQRSYEDILATAILNKVSDLTYIHSLYLKVVQCPTKLLKKVYKLF